MNTQVLITGGGGMLAQAIARELAKLDVTVAAPARAELDVTDEPAVHACVRALRPRTVIHCAAYTRVDDAEIDAATAARVNEAGTKHVAEATEEIGARFVYPSTDYVFDGESKLPYPPHAAIGPVNIYGRTKAAGERYASIARQHLILRLGWLYGPAGRNFVRTIVTRLKAGSVLRVVHDQVGGPTSAEHAAHALVAFLSTEWEPGIYHWANSGEASWHDMAAHIANRLGAPDLVRPCTSAEYGAPAKRPPYSVLDCSASTRITGPSAHWRTALDGALNSGSF
jgi:dTDP-4-dehydrorhamnose reductase